MRTVTSLLPLTAVAVVATVLVGTSARSQEFTAEGMSSGRASRAANEFGIKVGSVAGLRPGGEVTVPVRYSNPFPHTLVVRGQDLQVSSPSSACPSSTYLDLTAARTVLAKAVSVPAAQSKSISLVVAMRATAPDGCQGVRFTTTIRAEGRKT